MAGRAGNMAAHTAHLGLHPRLARATSGETAHLGATDTTHPTPLAATDLQPDYATCLSSTPSLIYCNSAPSTVRRRLSAPCCVGPSERRVKRFLEFASQTGRSAHLVQPTHCQEGATS